MLFREFNIIAAVAYAADIAALLADGAPGEVAVPWDELTEEQRNGVMQSVLAIGRGESDVRSPVFDATAKAILGYNGGQGGLALEEMANIARAPIELELVTEEDVASRPIREVVNELLNELADRRDNIHGTAEIDALKSTGPAYSDADLRCSVLQIAGGRAMRAASDASESIIECAQAFYDFIIKTGAAEPWLRISALQHAATIVQPGLRASTVTLVAEDFMLFLEPPQPEADAAPEVVTVQ